MEIAAEALEMGPALYERLKFDLERIDSMIGAVNDAYERVKALDGGPVDLGPLEQRIAALESSDTVVLHLAVSTLTEKLAALEQDIRRLDADATEMEGVVAEDTERAVHLIGALRAQLTAHGHADLEAKHTSLVKQVETNASVTAHFMETTELRRIGAWERLEFVEGRFLAHEHPQYSSAEDVHNLTDNATELRSDLLARAEKHNAVVNELLELKRRMDEEMLTPDAVLGMSARLLARIEAVEQQVKNIPPPPAPPDLSWLAAKGHTHITAPSHQHTLNDLPALEHAHDYKEIELRPDGSKLFACQVQGCAAIFTQRTTR